MPDIYDHQKPVGGLLSFRHFYAAEYRPGEDELTNYRAKKRKNGAMYEAPDEALNMQQRMARSRAMKRMKARIKIGRMKAKRRMASKEKLEKRAMRKARDQIVRKLTKDIPKSELSFARKQEIEKRLDKPQFKARIKRIARKMFPQLRKAEVQRKKG